MITIEDNVFGEKFHSNILDYCKNKAKFKSHKVGDKVFHCDINNINKLQKPIIKHLETDNTKITPIFSYYRMATEELDIDWRIHCDIRIFDKKPTNACIYYISTNDKTLNGTAIWKHRIYGRYCPEVTDEEHDRLLKEDANSLKNWNIDFVISAEEDRLVTYPSNAFHSKYPNKAWGKTQEDCRIIFCMFYIIDEEKE